jgi:capsular polysaccharide export protein
VGEVEMKTIVTVVAAHSEYRFFSRLANSIKPLKYSIVFLTPKLSLYLTAKLDGFHCHLIRNSTNTVIHEDVLQTNEVAGDIVDAHSAAVFFNAVQEIAAKIHAILKIDLVAVWNGSSVSTKALVQFARRSGIKTLFFELANIPEKIFVDPVGVNAQSLLFSSPDILEQFTDYDAQRYEEWKNNYLLQKRNELTTATAQYQQKVNNYLFLVDVIGVTFMNLPVIGNMNILAKVKEKVLRRVSEPIGDQYDLKNGKYIFFPMQVSNDSQLLFNSPLNNVEGIKYCIKKGFENKLDVVVKPHPAENSDKIFQQLRTLQQSCSFSIVMEPTLKILEHASEVVTLNSTVGLEAMIISKKVTFLGKTFYSFFNEQSIRQYIMGYLVDVEYFSSNEIPLITVQRILERSELK